MTGARGMRGGDGCELGVWEHEHCGAAGSADAATWLSMFEVRARSGAPTRAQEVYYVLGEARFVEGAGGARQGDVATWAGRYGARTRRACAHVGSWSTTTRASSTRARCLKSREVLDARREKAEMHTPRTGGDCSWTLGWDVHVSRKRTLRALVAARSAALLLALQPGDVTSRRATVCGLTRLEDICASAFRRRLDSSTIRRLHGAGLRGVLAELRVLVERRPEDFVPAGRRA